MLRVTERDDGVRFTVVVKPRSSRSRLEGERDGAVVIALKAAPVDGAANAELVKLLSRALGVRKSAVRIATGHNARHKTIDIVGATVADVVALVG